MGPSSTLQVVSVEEATKPNVIETTTSDSSTTTSSQSDETVSTTKTTSSAASLRSSTTATMLVHSSTTAEIFEEIRSSGRRNAVAYQCWVACAAAICTAFLFNLV